MAAGKYDFEVDQNGTFEREFIWKSSDGTPNNLDGYSVVGSVRRHSSDLIPLFDFTVEIKDQDTDPGAFVVSLTYAQCLKLPTAPSNGPFREELSCPYFIDARISDKSYPILKGYLKVIPR